MRQGNQQAGKSESVEPARPKNSQSTPPSRRRGGTTDGAASGRNWLSEPRTAVLVVLGAVVLFGGGRKLLHAWRSRKGVARLGDPDVRPDEIEAVARFGRAGLHELFRLFGEGTSSPQREAAGRALSRLWADDQLIAEEEQALVRRGQVVTWNARRRYPRALDVEVPIIVTYGLPFLVEEGRGVKPANLEWSHRVLGARRAALEEFSDWTPGLGRVAFSLVPGDFETNGPHRLVLQTRVRTHGLTDSWQIDLPHAPFQFEFDPRLEVDSLLALPDDARGEAIARAVRWEGGSEPLDDAGRFVNLDDTLTIRNPPRIIVSTPLPCDLAHSVQVEFDGIDGHFPAGQVLLSGQGSGRHEPADSRGFEIGPITGLPRGVVDRPGIRKMKATMTADAKLGWADPDVRSIWPGTIEIEGAEVEIVRR